MTDVANNRHTSEKDDWGSPSYLVDPARELLGGIGLDPASSAKANERIRARHYFDVADNGFLMPWCDPTTQEPTTVWENPPGGQCDAEGIRVVKRSDEERLIAATQGDGSAWKRYDGTPIVGKVQAAQKAWWFKLAAEYAAGRVRAAVFLGFSIEILQTTQVRAPDELRWPIGFPLCIPRVRVPFIDSTTGAPVRGNTHASVLVYLPDRDLALAAQERRFKELFEPIGAVRL